MRRAVLAAAIGVLGARGIAGAEPWKVTMEGGAEGVRLLVPDDKVDEALEVLRDS